MAKKIVISFLNNPIDGNSFLYDVEINNVLIPYNSGVTTLDLSFSTADSDVNNVKIQATLEETLTETVRILNTYYSYSVIIYTKLSDSIEVFINDVTADVLSIVFDASFDIEVTTETPLETYFLKYYMEYVDPMNVPYRVEILGKGFVGTSTLIYGNATLTKGSVKNALETIRGTGLDIELEADVDLTFEDLYSDEENQYKVRFYRNNVLMFLGFLKPDGIFQSFVRDRWVLNVSCVDGLGILKDLAFVQTSGLHWTGKQSALEIIYNCLYRTNTYMDINTAINVYYDGLTPSDTLDPLTEIYMSVNRFVKADNDTIMDCEEVLKSVLDLFNAQITQHNGQWYIERANEIAENPIVKYRKYSKTDNSYLGLNTKNQAFVLGSQINNRYPHHCSGNQQITIKGTVAAFRLNYKYGFVIPKLPNYNLTHSGLSFTDWTVNDSSKIINDPLKTTGIIINGHPVDNTKTITSSLVDFIENTTLNFSTKFNASTNCFLIFQIKMIASGQPDKYLKFDSRNNVQPQFNVLGSLVDNIVILGLIPSGTGEYKLENIDIPYDCQISVSIYNPLINLLDSGNCEFLEVNIDTKPPLEIGEFHTVTRKTKTSSIARETATIFNGDSPSIIYEGAIFKNDQETPTTTWTRRGEGESKPILRIAVEDVLRMSPKPSKEFTGDAYGYIPYLSLVQIDSITGYFKFTEYSFSSKTNITSFKLTEVFNMELPDIDYKLTYDFGNSVKPTIVS